jgi:hypothetical protein
MCGIRRFESLGAVRPVPKLHPLLGCFQNERRTLRQNGRPSWFSTSEQARQAVNELAGGVGGWSWIARQ